MYSAIWGVKNTHFVFIKINVKKSKKTAQGKKMKNLENYCLIKNILVFVLQNMINNKTLLFLKNSYNYCTFS